MLLFQILGNILKNQNTNRYATDAKEGGITFISIIFTTLLIAYLHNDTAYKIVFTIIPIIIYYISYLYIQSKYRSRNTRLYINYLLLKETSNQTP